MHPTDLRELIESFFKNLKCTQTWNDGILAISNVPADFQILYGKKDPYYLTFNPDRVNEQTELVVKGSFILRSISEYLDKKGQTTSIKLNFEENFADAFKRYLKLRNAQIHTISKTEEYYQVYKFTFQTMLQYLNEREQIINSIHVQDSRIIPFNLDSFSYSSFQIKEDSYQEEAKKAHTLAKESLKSLLMPRIQETSLLLKNKLTNEQDRIKKHYDNQRREFKETIARLQIQLLDIEKQKIKIDNQIPLLQKEAKIKESLKEIQNSPINEKLQKEESFFLNDELHKHSLNISTKLLNTTIISCPIFKFAITVKSKDSARQLDFEYNPITQELTPKISCELCNFQTTELFLCSSGHLSCTNCLRKCGDCSKDICSKCFQSSCAHCARRLCRRCIKKCPSCHATVCSSHSRLNQLTGKEFCTRCIVQCRNCSNFYPKSNIKDGICSACSRLSSLRKNFNS